jgi:hypothetical protein
MAEVFAHPDDVPVWQAAAEGEQPDWSAFLADYRAAVDWPSAPFWGPIAEANPDALILLSVRDDAETWWNSAIHTIFDTSRGLDMDSPFGQMWDAITRHTFTEHWLEPGPAMEAYERHNAEVRATAPADRLLEWRPGDGWEPICAALDLPVPEEPFPHSNSTEEFRTMWEMDEQS